MLIYKLAQDPSSSLLLLSDRYTALLHPSISPLFPSLPMLQAGFKRVMRNAEEFLPQMYELKIKDAVICYCAAPNSLSYGALLFKQLVFTSKSPLVSSLVKMRKTEKLSLESQESFQKCSTSHYAVEFSLIS